MQALKEAIFWTRFQSAAVVLKSSPHLKSVLQTSANGVLLVDLYIVPFVQPPSTGVADAALAELVEVVEEEVLEGCADVAGAGVIDVLAGCVEEVFECLDAPTPAPTATAITTTRITASTIHKVLAVIPQYLFCGRCSIWPSFSDKPILSSS